MNDFVKVLPVDNILFCVLPSSTSPLELPLPSPPSEMVSRRRILSRSRDDLHMDTTFQPPEDEEDVWYQKDKLYKVNFYNCISCARYMVFNIATTGRTN